MKDSVRRNQTAFNLCLSALSLIFSACNLNVPEGYFAELPDENTFNSVLTALDPVDTLEPLGEVDQSILVPTVVTQPNNCYDEIYMQSDGSSSLTDKVDILFVTDTSGSLDDEKSIIGDNIDNVMYRFRLKHYRT